MGGGEVKAMGGCEGEMPEGMLHAIAATTRITKKTYGRLFEFMACSPFIRLSYIIREDSRQP
jgi:hypothetical protein